MPPTGVTMSTFFSSPCASFFTFTLQADRASKPEKAAATSSRLCLPRNELATANVGVCIICSFLRHVRLPLNSSPALGNVGNAHRQMAPDGYFAKQSLDDADLRNGGVRKRANVILHRGEILGQIRVSH